MKYASYKLPPRRAVMFKAEDGALCSGTLYILLIQPAPKRHNLQQNSGPMTSLRVALKLSMAEAKPDEKSTKRKNPMLHENPAQEEPSLDDVLSGRKRRASFESKESKTKPTKPRVSARSDSPADESLTGRSETSGYYVGENNSILTEEPRKSREDDHESITSAKGDDSDDEFQSRSNSGIRNCVEEATTAETKYLETKEVKSIRDTVRVQVSIQDKAKLEEESPDNEFEHNHKHENIENEPDIELEGEGDADGENEVDNDGEGEASTTPRTTKKRRKRTSSILKSLEPINGEELPQVSLNDEDGGVPRYQSSRAAAMVAKTKMSVKGSGRSSSVEDLAGAADGMVVATVKKRKNAAGGGGGRGGGNAATGSQLNWVQCDKCAKWRSVAGHVDNNSLPDEWYCTLNTWDLHLANCDAPEEEEQVQTPITPTPSGRGRGGRPAAVVEGGDGEAGEAATGKRGGGRGSGGGRGRWRRSINDGGCEVEGELGDDDYAGDWNDENNAGGRRRSAGGRPSSIARGASGGVPVGNATQPVSPVNWVQCNKCRKWRKVPESIDVESLPDRWYCSLNTWNTAVARCTARQEADDVAANAAAQAAASDSQVGMAGLGGKNIHRGGRRGQGASAAASTAVSAFGVPGTIRQVSWVQCERRNCKKWRKVPAHIDTESFPEKWYCEMNTWDLDAATCDAPEPSDSENEQPGGAASRQQLILGNSKSANALSYRRIIFGTDGRIRVCFSDKNKNGYGIFSYSEAHKPNNDDVYTAPMRRVGYWWSGAYDECAGVAAAQNAHSGRQTKKAAALAEASAIDSTLAPKQLESAEPPAPTYLLDTARRLYGMVSKPPAFTWPKKVCKSWTILSTMPLFRRQNLECTVVMSCFLTSPMPQLLFSKLLALVLSCHFPDPEVEACRAYMNTDVLKATVKRLEDKGAVEVSYASVGQLSVEVIPSVPQLTQNCLVRGAQAVSIATGVSPAWTKQGLPLKLRKFYGNAKYKSSTEAISTSNNVRANNSKDGEHTVSNAEDKSFADRNEGATLSTDSAMCAVHSKHFRLQHREKWAAMAGNV